MSLLPASRTMAVLAGLGGALVVVLLPAAPARGASVSIAPGQEYTLGGDVTLTGSDSFVAGGDAGGRCKIHGAGHGIHSAETGWTGDLIIRNCDVDGLGVAGIPDAVTGAVPTSETAVGLFGGHEVTIAGTSFGASGQIAVGMSGDVNVRFQGNTIAEDSVVPSVIPLAESADAFYARGGTTGVALFQGNRVLKGRVHFDRTAGWLVGGDTPAEGNVLVGTRAGIFVERCGPITIRGNYSHTLAPGWNQVKNMNVFSLESQTLIEHNVFIGNAWNVEFQGPGELRYNLIVNPHERAWVHVWADSATKVHHNVLVQTTDNLILNDLRGGFAVFPHGDASTPPGPPAAEIYNNTLDGGGVCNKGIAGAVIVGAVLASLRSNAFVNIRLPDWTGIGLVGSAAEQVPDPLPEGFGYVDYNLFYNPDASVKANYTAGVAGKALRADPGFAYHDVPAGGAPNAQVPPKFAGAAKMPHLFPFDEKLLIDGSANICQVLAYYRSVYAPAAGSPLIDAGDPQEGEGNDIGAVGAGIDNALDRFGRLCDPADVGAPSTADAIFACPEVPLNGGSGGGGGSNPLAPGGHGFVCVCDAGAGAPAARGLEAAVALAGLALVLRPFRRRRAARSRGRM